MASTAAAASDGDDADDVLVPDVAAWAWIPRYDNLSELPPCGLSRVERLDQIVLGSVRTRLALTALLRTGNHPPPRRGWDGADEFTGWADTREYRGTLCLHQVYLAVRRGRAVDVKFLAPAGGNHIGYTPLRAGATVRYESGVGPPPSSRVVVADDGSAATLAYGIAYRIGDLLNVGNRAMTGHWAPYAWSRVTYRIEVGGRWEVQFHGSVIPSHTFVADWGEQRRWRAEDATEAEVFGFLTLGRNRLGPAFGVPLVSAGTGTRRHRLAAAAVRDR